MSIERPPKEVLEGVDWIALQVLEDHAQDLAKKGPINPHVFRALWAEALKAAKGHSELLQTLAMFGEPPGEDPERGA